MTESSRRVLALDQMRGLVMILMTIDHASEWLNKGRFVTDASWFWKPGTPIPGDQFLLRWITHLCAPTFVFLAGVGIALSTQKRKAQGDSDAAIDRTLFLRGLFILALELFWMTPAMMKGKGILLQVLYAIGVSMMLMVPLRRVPARALGIGALVFFAVSELLVGLTMMASGGESPSLLAALTFTGGMFPLELGPLTRLIAAYPFVHWLAIMALGYACAGFFARSNENGAIEKGLVRAGLASLAIFALVRGLNGYGNMLLLRDDLAPLQWLHVSKYPPSITFLTLELGVMALLLAGFYRLERSRAGAALSPAMAGLTLLGQAALFYYVIHIHLLGLVAESLGLAHEHGIMAALIGAALCVLALSYPAARYQRYKAAHPNGWTHYL
jgi:uncharacterized membrane protein